MVPDFCTVDLSQDLVAVTGHRVGSLMHYCYLLSIIPTKGIPIHPLACSSFLSEPANTLVDIEGTATQVTVHEDLLGWLVERTYIPDGTGPTLMVHNWKTGARLLVQLGGDLTFSFLGHSAFAVGYGSLLRLYVLESNQRITGVPGAQVVCVLHLPELSNPENFQEIDALALQIPRASHYDCECLFRPDPDTVGPSA
ncbi:hypothetical protein BV20DRAFT_435550 [Pilatotrama ljubarskyi]|nr:hypothetical protein BV20DRAFT_435550 [Pilatotrama ljubarskyi]